MKNIKYLICILLFVFQSLFAQNFWNKINGNWGEVEVTDLCLTQNGILLAYIHWDGLYYTTNNGELWTRTNYQGADPIAIETINDSIIIAGGYPFVKLSSDTGKTWLTTEDIYVFSLSYEPNSYVVYLGSNAAINNICGVYTSIDYGNTWPLLYSFPMMNFGQFIRALYVSRTNQFIFASVSYQGPYGQLRRFYQSNDNGQNWEIIYEDVYESVYRIIEDVSSNLYALAQSILLVSEDEGSTWIIRNISPSSSIPGSLATDYSGRIYRNSYASIHYSTDKGIYWTAIDNSGLTGLIKDIVINQNNRIYLATTNGVYFGEADSIVLSAENIESVKSFYLSQNYPNPFNPSTVISYQLPVSGMATLRVYDILGNEIATLVNEEKQPGTYEVEFNIDSHSGEVRNLSSGIYFYQLRAGNFIDTKKMVIIK